jgi:hypothetical protein
MLIMKKIFFTMFLFGLVATAYSQVSIYPFGGINFSRTSEDAGSQFGPFQDYINEPALKGFRAGLGLDIPLNNFFSIAPEIMYTQKGSVFELELDPYYFNFDQRFNFVEAPLLLRFKIGTENIKIYLNAGPHVGYWLGGRANIAAALPDPDTNETVSEEGNFKIVFQETTQDDELYYEDARRIEFGLNFGGGLLFRVGPGSIMLDGRYALGLTDLQRGNEGSFKSRTLGISLGYMIHLGR